MPLDSILAAGTAYKMDARHAYIIRKVGTDISGGTQISIDGKECGTYYSAVAPLRATTTGGLGPLDLGNLYYVIPPEADYTFSGSGNVRVIGELLILDPGETIPAEHLARYRTQHVHYITTETATYSFGAATSWAAGDEVSVYTITNETREKRVFNNYIVLSQTGITYSTGNISVLFFRDDVPLYLRDSTAGEVGLDFDSFVPTANTPEVFSLNKMPIELAPDHKFTIKAKNVSGGALTLSSASITATILLEYYKYVGGGT